MEIQAEVLAQTKIQMVVEVGRTNKPPICTHRLLTILSWTMARSPKKDRLHPSHRISETSMFMFKLQNKKPQKKSFQSSGPMKRGQRDN